VRSRSPPPAATATHPVGRRHGRCCHRTRTSQRSEEDGDRRCMHKYHRTKAKVKARPCSQTRLERRGMNANVDKLSGRAGRRKRNPSNRPSTTGLPTGQPKPTRPNDSRTKQQVELVFGRVVVWSTSYLIDLTWLSCRLVELSHIPEGARRGRSSDRCRHVLLPKKTTCHGTRLKRRKSGPRRFHHLCLIHSLGQ
jgi:hypothetical protein